MAPGEASADQLDADQLDACEASADDQADELGSIEATPPAAAGDRDSEQGFPESDGGEVASRGDHELLAEGAAARELSDGLAREQRDAALDLGKHAVAPAG
jgi:hypothetical protein